jgi:branched-chain amino acid transport system ATP-binding protein
LAAPERSDAATPVEAQGTGTLVRASGLCAGYGRRKVLHDVDIEIGAGEIVAIFGHNGAGKTTLLNSIFGFVRPTAGKVEFDGAEVTGDDAAANVRRGMAYIAAENFVFSELSVIDNLKLGGHLESSRKVVGERLAQVHALFPILAERESQDAGTLSGGQQRMLSVGMALMSGPRLLLVDEPSLGLAPALVQQVMEAIGKLAREESLSVILVEQNVISTLAVVDRAYFVRSGRILAEETQAQLKERDSFWELF